MARLDKLQDRIVELLEGSTGGPLSPASIAVTLGAVPGSVRRELVGLRRAGRVLVVDGKYSLSREPGGRTEENPTPKEGTLSSDVVEILESRYRAVLQEYSDKAEAKEFIRIPMSAESCLKPGAIASAIGAQGATVRSRLSELTRAGIVERVGDCYKARSILGRRTSRTYFEADGWRFRIYRDTVGVETAIVAPYGQERKRLRYDSRRQNYALTLRVTGGAGLSGSLQGAKAAYGNSYGEPLRVVAYPVSDYRVIDVDTKRFPGLSKPGLKTKLVKLARAAGALAYEETRTGGIHLIFPSAVEVPKEIGELQDPVYEDISLRRGYFATRPYTVRKLRK